MSYPASNPERIKILHVDDEDSQLDSFEEFMKINDPLIDVVSKSSPVEAIQAINQEYYDCIVTDFKMPEKNGIELSTEIREKRTTPIILYTGQGSEEVAEAAFRVGINDYIKKEMNPSHYHLLAKRIRNLVDKNRREELYLRGVEESREAIAIIVNDKIVYANNALIETLGLKSKDDIIGKKFYEFILPQDRDRVEENIVLYKNTEKISNSYQVNLRKKDGKKIYAEISVTTINYHGKKAILNFVRDISSRKILEKEIQSSENRFRTLVNLNPCGIALLNTKGEIIWVNPMFLRILGYPEKEIIGKSFFTLSSNKASTYIQSLAFLQNLLEGSTSPYYEFQWAMKNKELVWIEAHFSVIEPKTESQEIMVIIRDINQHKQIKDTLEQRSKNLENLVKEKTEKLIESEKMIAAGNLASIVANDIQHPLMNIKYSVNYIKTHPNEKDIYLEKINEYLSYSIDMLDDMREKTRDKPLKLEEVSIKQIITETINEIAIPPGLKIIKDIQDIQIKVDIYLMKRTLDRKSVV